MAHKTGKNGQVTSEATVVAGCDNWSLDTEGDVVETTDYESAGVKDFIPANIGWSGSFELNYDTAQDIANDPPNINEGEVVALELFIDHVAGAKLSGDAIITGTTTTVPQPDKIRITVTYQGTGALAKVYVPVP